MEKKMQALETITNKVEDVGSRIDMQTHAGSNSSTRP